MKNRTSVYVEAPREQARAISHVAVRVLQPEQLAELHPDVFDLKTSAKEAGDPNFYLSDGRVTLLLMPWDIRDYEGGGIVRPGPDHIGFRVECVAGLEGDTLNRAHG